MNPYVKRFLLGGARACGLFCLGRRVNRRKLRILSYHGVDDGIRPELNWDGFFVSTAVFRAHLEVLRKLRVVALDEAAARGEWPDDAVAITFDDGYANNLACAVPILREYGYPATFFLTTGFVGGVTHPWWFRVRAAVASGRLSGDAADWEGRLKALSGAQREAELARLTGGEDEADGPAMLSWGDVVELQRAGFSIGGHTAGHISFGHEDDETVRREIELSLSELRGHGIVPSCWYSYPYGQAGHVRDVSGLFEQAGIRAAVTERAGFNGAATNRYEMRRLGLTGRHSALAVEALVSL